MKLDWTISAIARRSMARALFRIAQDYKIDAEPDSDLKALSKFMRLLEDYDTERAKLIDELLGRIIEAADGHPPPLTGVEIHHIDGDLANNSIDNLRLVDPKENGRSK